MFCLVLSCLVCFLVGWLVDWFVRSFVRSFVRLFVCCFVVFCGLCCSLLFFLVVSVWLFVVCSCLVLVLSYRVLLLRMLLQLLFRSPSSLLNSICWRLLYRFLLKPSFEALTYVLRGEAFGTSVVCQKTSAVNKKFEILQFLETFCCPKFVSWRDTRKKSARTVGAQGRKMHGTFIKRRNLQHFLAQTGSPNFRG